MWYAVYRDDSGQLVSVGSVLADPMPDGLSVIELDGEPDMSLVDWDADTLAFIPRVDNG